MSIIELMQNEPGLFAVGLGILIIIVTATVMSYTIDRGAAIVLNTSMLTSGSFFALLFSLIVLYFVGRLLIGSNTLYNNYVFMMYIVLVTFIMIQGSLYLSLNQVNVEV
jgi:hypothetical protein